MKVIRDFSCMSDRYLFDFKQCTYKKGWAQVDTSQDAWYFGTWCNPKEFKICNYAEGDITLTICEDQEEFISELRKLAAWNKETGFWQGIDPGLNKDFKQVFITLGLGDLLHPDYPVSPPEATEFSRLPVISGSQE